ncbi:hypothetical protein AAG570_008342 [Ranatra chinensis]|uniref:leucine--tRNA ligase n=1 Tax=Ranatra chinensis TaxID=642074 RepID=A0ABD0XUW1_9HEMI
MERRGTFKVEYLQNIEREIQSRWDAEKIYFSDAPQNLSGPKVQKFFVTFPFPYMNGKLHLGHVFSLSKCEFAVRYQRMKGKKCLFPFGFHCTGMPIKACADKLKREMEQFGFPPNFSYDTKESVNKEGETDSLIIDKSKGKKSKASAKTVNSKYQWEIMQSLGLDDEEIRKFADESYWLDYFPPLAVQDLKSIGLHVDWRRSFITTDANPFFDSFVRWQFVRLRELGKIKYGKRYTIYSPHDKQPCMDHDRAVGEGVGAQEYTLIKMKVVVPYPSKLSHFKGRDLYLVAATLRPETMYGQTNCWVHPDLEYVAFVTSKGEVFVCTKRSALNMSYQGFTNEEGVLECCVSLTGEDILGLGLKAPLSPYMMIYSLPMLSIRADKGTGIVTSVPSDSPDDYACLLDLQNKQPLREKYRIDDYKLFSFKPIPIIDVPELGTLSAQVVYERLKIQSQNDREKLQEAKDIVYLKGFYDGVMLVGLHKGRKVQDVKKIIQQSLIQSSEAMIYYEPEKLIVSRSGDECVVALCDQWYLDYGEESWKKEAQRALSLLNTYHEEVKKNFISVLDWLHEHACSRTYGLGSRLPWDEQWLIESLSDSTIYMAYYTIAHFLQGNTFKGDKGNEFNIKPEDMTREVWDYIFTDSTEYPNNCSIDKTVLEAMRNEFRFWYPVDLRCSGKDLIQNHLTYFIYVHTAMWPNRPAMWPKGIRANGHLLLNSMKMSKSEGNFLTLSEAVKKFSADGMRFALADAGDSIEDANFVESIADAGILRLYNFIEWVKEVIQTKDFLRNGKPYNFHDNVFSSEINLAIKEAESKFEKMMFKEALMIGFFNMQAARDKYREMTLSEGMHFLLIMRFIKVQALLICPICPHVAEYVYTLIGENSSIVNASWPCPGEIDMSLMTRSNYLMDTAHSFRLQLKTFTQASRKGKGKIDKDVPVSKPSKATVWIARSLPPWQKLILDTMKKMHAEFGKLPDNKILASELSNKPELKKYWKRVMPFVQTVKEKVDLQGRSALVHQCHIDEKEVLEENKKFLLQTLNIEELYLKFTDNENVPDKIKEDTVPGTPFIVFERLPPGVKLILINAQGNSGYFKRDIEIRDEDTVNSVITKLNLRKGKDTSLWMWNDCKMGPRKMPVFNEPTYGRIKLARSTTFNVDVNRNTIAVCHNGKSIQIGNLLTYVVE